MLTLGLIGVGRWGTNIQRTLAGFRSVEVLPSQSAAETERLLGRAKNGELAGVIVATPGSTHGAVALPFIKLGLPTFIEKPLTTSLREAQQLERAAVKSKAPIMVGHVHLFNPAYQKAKSLVADIGRIRFLHFEGMNNGPFRDDMSALWDWGPHDVAMALDILDELPQSVQAWGIKKLRPQTELYDAAMVRLIFPKEIVVTLHISWLMPEKRKKMTVVGTNSTVVFDDTAERKVILYKDMGPLVGGSLVTHQDARVLYPKYSAGKPLEQELRAFIAMIKTGQEPASGLRQGIAVVRILEKAHQSMKLDGKKLTL